MGKMVFQFAKVKSRSGLRALLAHNLRVDAPANADASMSSHNMLGKYKTIGAAMDAYEANLKGAKVRKNAVYAHEYIISGTHEDLKGMSREKSRQYFKDSLAFLRQHYGKESLIMPVVHYDEKTPHMHVIVQPMKDGKLNGKHFTGGTKHRMAQMRTAFHKTVASGYGLDRGDPAPNIEKTKLDDYYQKAERELPEIEEKIAALTLESMGLEHSIQNVRDELTRAQALVNDENAKLERLRASVSEIQDLGRQAVSMSREQLQDALQEIERVDFSPRMR